jgi:hypothetical protein
MKLAKFVKSPAERKRYSIDYSEWLDTGELVSSIVFTVAPSTGAAPLVIDSYLIGTPATDVDFFANYGVDGVGYTVNVVMTTSGGQIKEDQILFSVKGA